MNCEECAFYIDVDQLVEMFFGDVAERDEFADAGVGEDNIDSSLHFADCLVKKIKIGHFGDVSPDTDRIGTDGLHGLIEFLLATPRDEDMRAFLNEQFCSCQPNTFCSAGDDGGLAFKLFGHRLSPLLLSRTDPRRRFCQSWFAEFATGDWDQVNSARM